MLLRCLQDGLEVPVSWVFGRAWAWDGEECFEFTRDDACYYEIVESSLKEWLEMDRLGLSPRRWSKDFSDPWRQGQRGIPRNRLPKPR
ncbi:MAG: hypothetical protein EXR99_13545 [Gemmataceae bacterium]|nr:hypothetical protein [Gemmataceae bacterium]